MITEQTATPVTEPAAPTFIGLKAYTEEQAKFFFGRDKEIDTLYKLVKNHTITIVFGKSGTGKTSLLHAGVFPKLRNDYCLPFRIQLNFSPGAPDLITQVKTELKTAIDSWGFKVDSYPGAETLWEYFHKEATWDIITPILVFDQFEEIFTLARTSLQFQHKQLDVLIGELADLAENLIPEKIKSRFVSGEENLSYDFNNARAKIVFSFREDYLAEIESITSRIPSIKYSRFRLLPMERPQATEVITKTWGNAIEPNEAEVIVSYLVNEPDADRKTKKADHSQPKEQIEPALLSQICSYIDEKRRNEELKIISAAFLARYPKARILRTLYDEVIAVGKAAIKPEKQGDLQLFIEDHLITDEGFRMRYTITEIDKDLLPGLGVLGTKYFTRQNDETVELTHDVIVTLVKNDREARRKQQALLLAKARAKRKYQLLLFLLAILCIGFWGFTAGLSWWHKKTLIAENNKLIIEQQSLTDKKQDLIKEDLMLQKQIDEKKKLKIPGSSGT